MRNKVSLILSISAIVLCIIALINVEIVNTGVQANDGSGDTLRAAFEKTNFNCLVLMIIAAALILVAISNLVKQSK